jgi:FkbM family methyltransferase
MSNYWDEKFMNKMIDKINIIFEVGSRYGDETLELSKRFPNTHIYSFECNPNTIDIAKEKLQNVKNVTFINIALGEENGILPFYSYLKNNDGASSFYKRIDFNDTQKLTGYIEVKNNILYNEII